MTYGRQGLCLALTLSVYWAIVGPRAHPEKAPGAGAPAGDPRPAPGGASAGVPEGIGLAYLEHAPVEVIDADRIRCRRPPTTAPPIDAASAPGDYRINQVPGGR